MRTQVGIVGAGPAGLMLSHLLHLNGIASVVLEARSRAYVEGRIRAGVIEQGTADLLVETGLGERMRCEGLVHHGINLRFCGRTQRIDLFGLTGGKAVKVYGQQEVVKDLIAARLAAGGQIHFEVEEVGLHDLETEAPRIRFRAGGKARALACDFIAGCDGWHGICRPSLPASTLALFERAYPFAWLGILAEAAPASEELIYNNHERGFALLSMRSPTLCRYYLQCAPDEDVSAWPDERIWQELQIRTAAEPGFRLAEGPVLQKSIAPMRSFVVEPMQHGRLFLAGDAAHIVPATGAKGMNLAIADVRVLAQALAGFYGSGRTDLLERYSEVCLRRVWRAQRFSWWMTSLTHRFEGDAFGRRLQQAELHYLVNSRAAATALAENYVGLPFD
jgi:p-hydroxybenzoate 3-monooxygenase